MMTGDQGVQGGGGGGPILRVLEGSRSGEVHDLAERDELTLGSDGSDESASSHSEANLCRFRVERNPLRVMVEDLSGRGLLVNQLRVSDRVLESGDLVLFGDAVVLYVSEPPPVRPRALGFEGSSPVSLDLIEIPKLFHSVYGGGAFTECLICSGTLSDETAQYSVEKVFRGTEVVMECAICLPCMQKMQSEFSEESRKRLEALGRELGRNVHSLIHCELCQTPRETLREYNLIGGCLGAWMIREAVFVLCGDCVEKIQELLSETTRDTHRDFIDTQFPGVPLDLDMPSPLLL